VIRKHTRRAVKAAFAISLGVAILIGTSAQAAQPTVVIGTKNFTEQFVLGQLYKQALEAKGFKVGYKENIGSSELIDTAARSGKINLYPEYLGVIVLDIAHQKFPKTAQATFLAAKKFEETRGLTLLRPTAFTDVDSFAVLTTTAKKYNLKTISDVKRVPSPSYGGYPECRTRITCLLGLKRIYGLKSLKFVALGTIPVTTLLDQGKITGGDIFTTQPEAASSKYVLLADTKHIFGFQNIAPIVSKKLVTQLGPKFTAAVNAVSAKLTIPAMIAMNKAVGIDKQPAAAVADKFLRANGLK
jgi:osmoprotectant transport system substrate-binding protein